MEKDIKAIIVMLATQAMINLGEIEDPLNRSGGINLEGATIFIDLLSILEQKTQGNLSAEEASFLLEVKDNLNKVYNKKREEIKQG